jgi:hypothetical protein
MLSTLLKMTVRGIAASKVEPGMVLTAARDIFVTILDRRGAHHDILFANEGDQVRVEAPDCCRPGDLFVCSNVDNFDEVASVNPHDLEDMLKEYT